MELWDIYDIDRVKKDGYAVRGEPLTDGSCHMGAHICVFNSKGQLLIQKRVEHKSGYGGRWDLSAAGSALAGETSRQVAHRELLEEIGIDYDFEGIRPHFTINRPNIFDDFYIIQKDVDISRLTIQKEEVSEVRWAELSEIFELIEKKEFVPYYTELICLIFAMRGRYSSYRIEE